MSDPEKRHTKSRRRFLADMLFLGGGVTAANVGEALGAGDGVVVSSALMRPWFSSKR